MAEIDIFVGPTLPLWLGGIPLIKPVEWRVDHPRLFRYGAADLFLGGSVKISTLSACRAHEDTNRRDEHEGKKYTGTRTAVEPSNPELPPAARLVGLDGDFLLHSMPMTPYRVPAVFLRDEMVEDAYIFCLSRNCTARMRTAMGSNAVMITNPRALIALIDEELRKHAPCELSACVADDVQYNERVVRLEDGVKDAAFIKPISYSHECEMRALWIPVKSAPLKPVIFRLPAITEFLAEVGDSAYDEN